MAGSFDSSLIDQIVSEVLDQLRRRAGSVNSSPRPTRERNNRQTENGSEGKRVVELSEAVITAETLKQKSQAGIAVRVSPQAIITPSARDYLRDHEIQVVREDVGAADLGGGSTDGVIVAAHLPGAVQTFLEEIKRQSANWNVEIESGVRQVIERSRSVICRGEAPQVVVFAGRPHRVACFLNRNSQCRAAVVARGSDVRKVRTDLGANVICVDVEQPTYMRLREIFRAVRETRSQIREPS